MSRHVAVHRVSHGRPISYAVQDSNFNTHTHNGSIYTQPDPYPSFFVLKLKGKKKSSSNSTLYSKSHYYLSPFNSTLPKQKKKKRHHSPDLKYPLSPQKHSRNVPELEVSTVILVAFRDSGGGGGGSGRSETRPEMERNTPVRKPHTSTADLLTWSETPIADSASLTSSASRSASRPHQVSKFDFEIPCFGD